MKHTEDHDCSVLRVQYKKVQHPYVQLLCRAHITIRLEARAMPRMYRPALIAP
jgi:hypothetical protein